MARSQRNDNFIDKTFTVMADIILKVLPINPKAKEAFVYYRDGMSAQADGEYAEALENYEEALRLEEDPSDRSEILYNMGLIHASNGKLEEALDYYHQCLELNPRKPSALNNIQCYIIIKGINVSRKEKKKRLKVCLIRRRNIGSKPSEFLQIVILRLKTG